MRLLVVVAMLAACGVAPLFGGPVSGPLADGAWQARYSRFPNGAEVRVTVAAGRVASVEVLHHSGSWIGKRAVPVIPRRIVEAQSTRVDAVSGATNSSRVIMNAAYLALLKSRAAARGRSAASRQ